jgi:LacI family transcriptional regulator
VLTLGVLQAIEEAGLSVPGDISLIAWNDVLLERKPVSITSVCFDRFEAGARLCRRLLECIEQPDKTFELEYLRPKLIVRESTGAPRGTHH